VLAGDYLREDIAPVLMYWAPRAPKVTQTKTPTFVGVFLTHIIRSERLTLASLETWVRFADHKDFAAAADDFTVAVTGLRRFK